MIDLSVVPSFHYPKNESYNQFEFSSMINKQAKALKQRIQTDSKKYDEQFRIGIEIEICLVDNQCQFEYLYKAINEERQLRPLSVLREERMAVVRSGYNAQSHFNIVDTIRSQIDFAKKGLVDLGLKEEFLSILEKRIEYKNSPGDYVAKLWHEKFNGASEQTVSEIIAHIWEKTKTNQPIA